MFYPRHIAFITLISISPVLSAQNLVVNGGFENYTLCPTNVSNFNGYADNWLSYYGSPDFYHPCGFDGSPTTNNNSTAHSGLGFTGFFCYGSFGAQFNREYMHGELSGALVAGKIYEVEYYVKPVIVDIVGFSYGIDQISLHASPAPITYNTPNLVLPLPAQVNNSGGVITNLNGWTKISGCFMAEGGERFITIGNFNIDANTLVQPLPGAVNSHDAYFLIDDISMVEVSFPKLPDDTSVCAINGWVLDVTAPGATYAWQDGSTASTFTVNSSGTYWVDITLGGCTLRDSCVVDYIEAPPANNIADQVFCKGYSVTVDVSQPGNTTYLWFDGSTGPEYTFEAEGAYTVTITNDCGTVTDTFLVSEIECQCNFFVPNSFTPNADFLNEGFRGVFNCGFLTFEMIVYNRYGQIIFYTDDPNAAWDGKHNDILAPLGVYVWTIRGTYFDGAEKDKVMHGHVNLIR